MSPLDATARAKAEAMRLEWDAWLRVAACLDKRGINLGTDYDLSSLLIIWGYCLADLQREGPDETHRNNKSL